jgi:hypothetical protein
MPEPELSTEAKKLVSVLKQGGLAFNRKDAAEKIGKLPTSSGELVAALIQAREFDVNEEVRKTAAEALQAPAHQAVLEQDPGLEQRASVPPKGWSTFSLLGTLSYAFAMVSVVLVYLDLFVVDPYLSGMANPLGLGAGGATTINAIILLVGSFLLPLAGFILGVLAVRQFDRKPVFGIIGMTGNMLILLATSYSVISR